MLGDKPPSTIGPGLLAGGKGLLAKVPLLRSHTNLLIYRAVLLALFQMLKLRTPGDHPFRSKLSVHHAGFQERAQEPYADRQARQYNSTTGVARASTQGSRWEDDKPRVQASVEQESEQARDDPCVMSQQPEPHAQVRLHDPGGEQFADRDVDYQREAHIDDQREDQSRRGGEASQVGSRGSVLDLECSQCEHQEDPKVQEELPEDCHSPLPARDRVSSRGPTMQSNSKEPGRIRERPEYHGCDRQGEDHLGIRGHQQEDSSVQDADQRQRDCGRGHHPPAGLLQDPWTVLILRYHRPGEDGQHDIDQQIQEAQASGEVRFLELQHPVRRERSSDGTWRQGDKKSDKTICG